MGLRKEVFDAIFEELNKPYRKKDLQLVKKNSGFEHWFKFPITMAIKDMDSSVEKWQGDKGPDIVLQDGTKIELKAFSSKSFWTTIVEEGIIKKKKDNYPPCLFLCKTDLEEEELKENLKNKAINKDVDINISFIKRFNDGKEFWILGCAEKI